MDNTEMSKIKIISNPYSNSISYYRFSEKEDKWIDFNDLDDYDGKLIEKEFSNTFFPFKVKDIVERIKKDCHTIEHPVDLFFEGTKDEFDDLCDVCKEKGYEGIHLNYSDKRLANAREILPEIKAIIPKIEKIYENMESLLDNDNISDVDFDGEKIKSELRKVKDATSSLIPICIIGNYSSGKSSFINALIGREILPNGDEPITSKVFKISRSKSNDTAVIKYTVNGTTEKIIINASGIVKDESSGNIYNSIVSDVLKENETDIFRCINKSLEILNNYEKQHNDTDISDLIEITVPFGKGMLSESKFDYVVFDTPGSNTASNTEHVKVMEEAMANMSNGIPIYISEYDTLDTIDNRNLNDQIKAIDELDTRFTFIIVNKADSAKLPANGFDEKKELEVLDEEVPRNLYAGGLFFVSSVIALGAKTNGSFIDSHYYEIYDEKLPKFSTPGVRNYKQLYKYNILPPQIKQKSIKDAEQCSDIVLANSGLYTVESEIETFSKKYSAYNKCQQSYKHIDRAIEISKKYIKNAKEKCVKDKEELVEKLESEKLSLGKRLDEAKTKKLDEANSNYNTCVYSSTEEAKLKPDVLDLKNEFDSLCNIEFQSNVVPLMQESYNELKNEKKKAQKEIWGNVKTNHTPQNVINALKTTASDGKKIYYEKERIKKEVSKCRQNASNKLINQKEKECQKAIIKGYETLENNSASYWKNESEAVKNYLSAVVTDSSELSEEKRNELSQIIMNYDEVHFDESDIEKFERDSLSARFNFGNIHWFKSDFPNYSELSKEFERCLNDGIEKYTEIITKKYKKAFEIWIGFLLEAVKKKMVEYNPGLYEKSETIKKTEQNIDALIVNNQLLEDYSSSIKDFISWKHFGKEV